MPKIDADFTDISTSRCCKKCGSEDSLARHHTGCEKMWLRHFEAQESAPVYKKFKSRYESFHRDDIVLLCATCHKRIHEIYFVIISIDAQRSQTYLHLWTWKQANKLMNKLRQACDIWLKDKGLA